MSHRSTKNNNVAQDSVSGMDKKSYGSEPTEPDNSDDEYEWQQVRVKKNKAPNDVRSQRDETDKKELLKDSSVGERNLNESKPIYKPEVDEIDGVCLKENEYIGRPLNLRY